MFNLLFPQIFIGSKQAVFKKGVQVIFQNKGDKKLFKGTKGVSRSYQILFENY